MTPTVLPLWLEVIKAVAPLLAALLAAGVGAWVAHKFGRIQEGISRQQAETAAAAAKTAKNKLKLELFERRWQVYDAVYKALGKAVQAGDMDTEAEKEYLHAIRGAKWIFNHDIQKYLSVETWELFNELHLTYMLSKESPERATEQTLRARRNAATNAVLVQLLTIDDKFESYLQLEA